MSLKYHLQINYILYTVIKISFVCLSVRDKCGHGHKGFVGRVQKYHVRFSFTEMAVICLEIVKAAAGRGTLRCR